MRQRILVVEDEPQMRVILQDNLQFEGYDVLLTDSGEQGLELCAKSPPDLVLLDIMLPRMNGYEMCRRLRRCGFDAPIIMITARNAEPDRISGLEFGADDYVGKPFSIPELMARIRAQLRRRKPHAQQEGSLSFGDLVVDFSRRDVWRNGRPLDLSSREFELLAFLIAHEGETISRDRLLNEVWGYPDLPLTRTVDNFVAKLRRKIERRPHKPRHIVTVHGTGYRFVS